MYPPNPMASARSSSAARKDEEEDVVESTRHSDHSPSSDQDDSSSSASLDPTTGLCGTRGGIGGSPAVVVATRRIGGPLSPVSSPFTMEQGCGGTTSSALSDISVDPYFHTPVSFHDQVPGDRDLLDSDEEEEDGSDDDEGEEGVEVDDGGPIGLRGGARSGGGQNTIGDASGAGVGGGAGSYVEILCGPILSTPPAGIQSAGGHQRLQYGQSTSAFTNYTHHLVESNHHQQQQSSSRQLLFESSSAQSPGLLNMNPSDSYLPSHHQLRNQRRASSSSSSIAAAAGQVGSGGGHQQVYGGNMFDGVLSPAAMVDGCHSHPQAFATWYNGSDVPFESLLPSPVNALFPFPPNPAHFDSPHAAFPFFPTPVVNSPSSSSTTPIHQHPHLHYFQQQHHQSQHHQQQQQQLQLHQDRQQLHQFPSAYLNNRNLHFPHHQQQSNAMPQPTYTGFAAGAHAGGGNGGGNGQNPKSNKKGGRRPKEEQQHLPPEEEQKRKQRRERNKEAAARCRKRRLDHMTELSDQVHDLQRKQSALEQEVEQLAKEKEELEFVLQAHEPSCRIRGQHHNVVTSRISSGGHSGPPPAKKFASNHQPAGITVTAVSKSFLPMHHIKNDVDGSSVTLDCDDKSSMLDPPLNSGMKPNKMSSGGGMGSQWNNASANMRPDTLRFNTGDLDSPGIPINTPSKIFSYDPMNSALNMPTGMTPMTTGLTPILHLASAAATLETPTTSVLNSLDGSGPSGSSGGAQKNLQSL